MPIFAKKEHDMLVKSKAQREAEQESQRKSQLVKKKRHGKTLTLISLGTKTESRGGKKSRRKFRTHKWVDPELVGGLPAIPARRARRVRSR